MSNIGLLSHGTGYQFGPVLKFAGMVEKTEYGVRSTEYGVCQKIVYFALILRLRVFHFIYGGIKGAPHKVENAESVF